MYQRDVNNLLPRLQRWYAKQCNGEWEHQHGAKVETLDNPGWLVKIDIDGTPLDSRPFQTKRESVYNDGCPQSDQWLHCSLVGNVWQGAGDPTKLARILEEFLTWAESQYA